MRTATLPIRHEQFNTGTSASTSEMVVNCAAIKNASETQKITERYACGTGANVVTADTGSGEVPLFAIRPANTVNGRTNRIQIRPTELDFGLMPNGDPIAIRVYRGLESTITLTGGGFAHHSTYGGAEINNWPTGVSFTDPGSDMILQRVLTVPGHSVIQFTNDGTHDLELYNKHDLDLDRPIYVVTALVIDSGVGTETANVSCMFNWAEPNL